MKQLPRRKFIKILGSSAMAVPFSCSLSSKILRDEKPNVLFIAVDDLRPELGCYGNHEIISPHIDRLAREGLVFDHAYCQQPICMASRASLMSGYRPDFNNIYNCGPLTDLVPNALTINKHFENNGYDIWASGKIYHHGIDREQQFGDRYIKPNGDWQGRGYIANESIKIIKEYQNQGGPGDGRGPAFEAPDVPDNAYHDGVMTELAIDQLQNFKNAEKPFFMALGFKKPHLPFNAPKKYWDMYSEQDIKLAENPFLPKNATKYTPYNFGELRNYYGIPKNNEPFSDDLDRKLKHGYYACVTYIDTQIGKVLTELEKLKLRENTIIILWGDHGWKLGEHGMWCKHTPFELDCRVPMIISVPDSSSAGKRITSFAEYVDIYPTLCELCGLELPEHLQGDSLVPVIKNPDKPGKTAAYTQWPKSHRTDPEKVITGYSVKTKSYRYTEWTRNSSGEVLAKELYNHENDPNENINIADYTENQAVVDRMSKLLDGGKGWKNNRLK